MRSALGSSPIPHFLLVERDLAVVQHVQDNLSCFPGATPQIFVASTGSQASKLLRANEYAVVLIDLATLQDLSCAFDEAITRLSRLAGSALVVVLSEAGSVSSAVGAMRAGAHECVTKPLDMHLLASRLSELGHRHGNSRALCAEQPAVDRDPDFEGFIGASEQMQAIYEQITLIAPSPAPVFITGESGSGKEVCAAALHKRGPRANHPFVAINCSAIPKDLMESEIFGVVRGAYTGAMDDRKGAVELADGGVLFLDEIGDMDTGLQAKLLRFLQTGTYNRVGEAVARPVDVRVICATNHNPMQLIAERKFREDLFYRLHVLPIHLPPLRQRPADILPLATSFLRRYAAEENKDFAVLAPDAADMFVARDWPGNVRQLQNIVRRIVVMFNGTAITGEMVSAADIESRSERQFAPASQTAARKKIMPMWQQERDIIESAVVRFDGNIAQAAAALEISPSTIYRKRQSWLELEARSQVAYA